MRTTIDKLTPSFSHRRAGVALRLLCCAVVALAGMSLGERSPRTARANEVIVSSVCGSGYGGSYVGPYYTAYTTSASCYIKFLEYTYYTTWGWGQGGDFYSPYNQNEYLPVSSISVAGQHRVCSEGPSLCSAFVGTSDS